MACKSTFITFAPGVSQRKTRTAYQLKVTPLHRLLLVNLHYFSFRFSFQQHRRSVAICSGSQWSVATGHPPQWQVQNEKHSRPWHIELGATRQQVVLSPRRGLWVLEWNGQRGFLLWDEWRWRCCFWSAWVAEYWGIATEAEDRGSACPPNFTVEVCSSH